MQYFGLVLFFLLDYNWAMLAIILVFDLSGQFELHVTEFHILSYPDTPNMDTSLNQTLIG